MPRTWASSTTTIYLYQKMRETYYKKRGRRYVPVAEYDSDLMDSFPAGTHLVQCYPGGSLRKFNIDPAYAPMIAAGRVAEEAICEVLRKASDLRPQRAPITEGQRKAWAQLSKEFGNDIHALQWPSARDACEQAVMAMCKEAEKLLDNASVRAAYDHFILMCELTKKHDNT
jgi:hypothetical protein